MLAVNREYLKGRQVLVVGLARSGVAAAELLLKQDAWPVLYDAKPLEKLRDKARIEALIRSGCRQGIGLDPFTLLSQCDVLLISPAVPCDSSLVGRAAELNIPVIGELELGALFAKGPILALTGTNGKTTTVSLLGEMLKAAGKNTRVCGNIGYPICAAVQELQEGDPLVAEVSSFQLETISSFHPRVAAVTNITPDHLDRHGSMENYIALKRKIFVNQTADDYAVLNADDAIVSGMAAEMKPGILWFSTKREVQRGAFIRDGKMVLKLHGTEQVVIETGQIRLPGEHNLQNALTSVLMAAAANVPVETIAETLRNFSGVEHRIEFVRTFEGISYINDSKGTNPESTMRAVEAMTAPTVLLAGGYDKRISFDALARLIRSSGKIVHVVLYGQTAEQIEKALREAGYTYISRARDMFEAVERARSFMRVADGNILLSPACASFDQFSDYEQRGKQFKEYVLSLKEKSHAR